MICEGPGYNSVHWEHTNGAFLSIGAIRKNCPGLRSRCTAGARGSLLQISMNVRCQNGQADVGKVPQDTTALQSPMLWTCHFDCFPPR